MGQNQNPGMGTPMGPQRNMGDIASMLSSMGGRPGGPTPAPMAGNVGFGQPPQGAPGQGPGGAKGGMQKQIAGLQGGPPPGGGMRPMGGPPPGGLQGAIQNLNAPGGGGGQQGSLANMLGTMGGPKNPNAPQPNASQLMPGQTQGPASLGMAPGQAGGGLAQQGQNANIAAKLAQGRKMMGQGAPGQGAGGNKNQQMATLPGGPR